MGIARAIERAKRQAKQGALAPLRGAALRIAALFTRGRHTSAAAPEKSAPENTNEHEPGPDANVAGTRSEVGAGGQSEYAERAPTSSAAGAVSDAASVQRAPDGDNANRGSGAAAEPEVTAEPSADETGRTRAAKGRTRVAPAPEPVPGSEITTLQGTPETQAVLPARAARGERASITGADSGAEPGEPEPNARTAVDATVVGATPSFNATPEQVEPVDATPIDMGATDATPVAVDVPPVILDGRPPAPAATVNPAPAEPASPVEAEQRDGDAIEPAPAAPARKSKSRARGGNGTRKRSGQAAANEKQNKKEALAPSDEAAKTLARPSSRDAPKPAGARAGTTSKKK